MKHQENHTHTTKQQEIQDLVQEIQKKTEEIEQKEKSNKQKGKAIFSRFKIFKEPAFR